MQFTPTALIALLAFAATTAAAPTVDSSNASPNITAPYPPTILAYEPKDLPQTPGSNSISKRYAREGTFIGCTNSYFKGTCYQTLAQANVCYNFYPQMQKQYASMHADNGHDCTVFETMNCKRTPNMGDIRGGPWYNNLWFQSAYKMNKSIRCGVPFRGWQRYENVPDY